MAMLPHLTLYLSVLSTREEVIFLLRIMAHQLYCSTPPRQQNLRHLCDEVLRGESKREAVEEETLRHLGEGVRKLLAKIVKKAAKMHTFYLNKTQVVVPPTIVYRCTSRGMGSSSGRSS